MSIKNCVPALVAGAFVTFFALAPWVQGQPPARAVESPAITKAIAVMHPTRIGGEAAGIVTFTLSASGMRVVADIHGLTPGPHGFHIHEYGDCSSPDAKSAGPHFDPHKTMKHASPTAPMRHVGDLGNIEADARGHGKLDLIDPALTFTGHASILGRGLIIHAKSDDLKSQPAGNAGDRVSCGVIGVAKAE